MVIFRYLQAKTTGFQQSFPHFPQWKMWMDESGEKWWKMGIEERIKQYKEKGYHLTSLCR